jgi:pimeloyl-ACP methyl ester carboxylesterase
MRNSAAAVFARVAGKFAACLFVACVFVAALLSGCWHAVDKHCRGCTIVSQEDSAPLAMPPSTRAVVILVHGAFGFGEEWRPVVDALKAKQDVVVAAWKWRGPFTRKPAKSAEAFRQKLQAIVDAAPAPAKIVVLAHSAGGMLTSYVASRLRVPADKPAQLVSIAGTDEFSFAPLATEKKSPQPPGALPPRDGLYDTVAPNITYVAYINRDEPAHPKAPMLKGTTRVFLGHRMSHNGSIAAAGLPIVEKL